MICCSLANREFPFRTNLWLQSNGYKCVLMSKMPFWIALISTFALINEWPVRCLDDRSLYLNKKNHSKSILLPASASEFFISCMHTSSDLHLIIFFISLKCSTEPDKRAGTIHLTIQHSMNKSHRTNST